MTAPDVTIVDYGVGNLGSLRNALAKVGRSAEVSGDPATIAAARRIILPGVGAFDRAVEQLRVRNLSDVIVRAARDRGVPLAGVCLGMQLLMDGSDEGVLPGLGLVSGRARRFPDVVDGRRLLIPHMGWSTVSSAKPSRLAPSLTDGGRYYFVHSFAVEPDREEDVLTWTDYGTRFASTVERDNVIGIQFHPEKSHRFGLAILREFAEVEL
ncbi:imidazole glycerol phosphate synthase subunit HisH [Microbacterium sp. zg.B48]|uniref:imidazole glycerol phosphate synthase subunit HisH n=1 Tax=unclassified Microbacterium TaxID=2609290 RepID=UPI00214AE579|nr:MULTISPECIES: imidazole glycerol phosphate synthase subunit HisH [unclassified Microbacterium]MCR2765136.1 imidazole glycerol phosphate synthase subunit HisH [Microbacterium sp. zg.B48]MCR2810263.1 imidazole glycerol phosphate synthase subunit HisH [Microbacterium sp. zg.B185]WIM19908.1 imidazole glycerol phosphate synthase subunit HisH [Microbacterium sp. zg-B185]